MQDVLVNDVSEPTIGPNYILKNKNIHSDKKTKRRLEKDKLVLCLFNNF